MSGINRVPLGLLSLLDSQTQGKNPDLIYDVVTPTLTVDEFYLSNKGVETVTKAGDSIIASGSFCQAMTVPEGELWAVRLLTGEAVFLDALSPTVRLSIGYRNNVSEQFIAVAAVSAVAVIGNIVTMTASFDNRLMMRSGSTFSMRMDSSSIPLVTGFDTQLNALIVRLKV